MKYLNLIWKLFAWNLICFFAFLVFFAFISGNPPFILMATLIIGFPIGTIIGIARYQKYIESLRLGDPAIKK